jgi:TonB family protein
MSLRIRIATVTLLAWTSWSATLLAQVAPAADAAPAPAAPAVTPPKLAHFVQAEYPTQESATGRSAAVVLAISIGADGKVADVTVAVSAGDAFDAAATAAARLFEFEPALVDGKPVAVRIQYRYEFILRAPPPPAAPTTADFTGTVRIRGTGQPLAGVVIELDGARQTTDASGLFHFADVSPGPHNVAISGSGFTPTATEETFEAGQSYDARYDVDLAVGVPPEQQVDFEMVIVDSSLKKSMASTSVSSDQGARVAGTGGDVIKVVENLPGVARSSVGSSALVVWGAAGTDTRVYIDDVRVPMLYHEGGFRSVIHSDLVRSVELEPGGYGAAHGRGLGGLVSVGLKPLEADGYHGSLSLDAIDAAGSIRGSVGDKFRFAGAVRRSHLDWVVAQVTSQDVGAFVPIPRYWDSQLRAAWVPHEGESIEVGSLLSSDSISRAVAGSDPSDTKRESKGTGFERIYLRYQKQLDAGGTVTATPYFGFDHSRVTSLFGAVPAQLDNNAAVYGMRTAWSGSVEEFLTVTTGIDAEVVASKLKRAGSITSPPREGDIRVFGQAPSDLINADSWTTTNASLAPFAQADLSLASGKLHLIPGARIEPAMVQASRRTPASGDQPTLGTMHEQTFFEPRLAARWAITDVVGVRAAVGIYHQPPLAEDLSAVFGNPGLGASQALHYLTGGNLKLTDTLSLEATGFVSEQSSLPTRSPFPTPIEAQALVQKGLGRAYGGQVLLRRDLTDRFFGWVSYSLVRSERTDGASQTYRPFDFDQTHVLTVLASYDLGGGFETGARFRFSSGYPRTPVVAAVYDSRTDSFQPVFGAHNSIRIPAFYEFDVRISKRFSLGSDGKLEVYLDVQNVSDHRNPEEIVYNYNFSRKSYITGLPILPVLGAKLTW